MKEKNFKHIVVLTGAGISAESGIATFREKGGLWEQYSIEDVATPQGYAKNPKLVLDFYNQRRRQLTSGEISPNPAHTALADFEKRYDGHFLLVTQNVDNLHESGGSQNILHMHGEMMKIRCSRSGKIFYNEDDITLESECSCCGVQGTLRPHVVWFGEMPLYMEKIEEELRKCDLFISIGTSGNVYPAAMFVQMAKMENPAVTIEINLEATQVSDYFDQKIQGPASTEVPKFLSTLL
jgi:NAD-dependent deacetylase